VKLQALQTLIQVAEAGSVRAASIRWRRNMAPMIAQIRMLESELGFALLEDGGGAKAQLTPAGAYYAARARTLIEVIEQAGRNELAIAEGTEGELRLGICEEVATPRLTRLLRECSEHLPGLRLQIIDRPSAALAVALRRHEIDIALLLPNVEEEGITIEPLWHEDWRVVLPPGHALKSEPHLACAQLRGIGLILSQPDLAPSGHDLIRATFAASGITPRVAAQVIGRPTMLMLVSAGVGATFLPASFFAGLRDDGQPEAVPFEAPPLVIAAAFHRNNPAGAAMRFLRLAREG